MSYDCLYFVGFSGVWDGDLSLYECTEISELPDGLSVSGDLYLRGTAITHLPDGLYVGGFLDLCGCTLLTQIPDRLSVGGHLCLGRTGIKKKGFKKPKGVKGEVSFV